MTDEGAGPPDLLDELDASDVEVQPGVSAPEELRRPDLPPARRIELPDGSVELRELTGPPDATAIILLHGWTATADLNFFRCYRPFGEHHRVLAFDHRGHGTGLRSRRTFRLEDCADDVVAMADAIGLDRFVVFGYSMGGAIAQLVWRRHRERVLGMVLTATATHFKSQRDERLNFLGLTGLGAVARFTPAQVRRWLTDQLYLNRKTDSWEPWAIEEASGHDWRMMLEAGAAIGRFRSDDWITEVDVPTSVIITMKDEVVPLSRQMHLYESIPTAHAFRVDAGHDAAIAHADRYVRVALSAIATTIERTSA